MERPLDLLSFDGYPILLPNSRMAEKMKLPLEIATYVLDLHEEGVTQYSPASQPHQQTAEPPACPKCNQPHLVAFPATLRPRPREFYIRSLQLREPVIVGVVGWSLLLLFFYRKFGIAIFGRS
jgi:hypothetical protein